MRIHHFILIVRILHIPLPVRKLDAVVEVCNGLRGLKMNQPSCHILKGLDQETFNSMDVNETYDDTVQIEHQINSNSVPTIKPGIKLPKSDYDLKFCE